MAGFSLFYNKFWSSATILAFLVIGPMLDVNLLMVKKKLPQDPFHLAIYRDCE